MAKNLMIQGTMSGAGKSILTAGILRLLTQDGCACAPFKSQNMALNSFVTKDGLEMGRAQVVQAAACRREPSADMNPILLKPLGDTTSQVIVNGLPRGNLPAREYFRRKKELIPDILAAYQRLEKKADIIVIEGAGSPVEINLRENDIVNMGLAELVDAPVFLAGNIDPGGVFAQLLGTMELFSAEERRRVKGLIINKFRGDASILLPGLSMFRKYCDVPFAGIVPWIPLDLDEEDSISEKLENRIEAEPSGIKTDGRDSSESASDDPGSDGFGNNRSADDAAAGYADKNTANMSEMAHTDQRDTKRKIKIAVLRLPFISNYTDFDVLQRTAGVLLQYVKNPAELGVPDLIILPGSKNTISDLLWLRETGLESAILRLTREANVPVMGICGGFQMLGDFISDTGGEEGGGTIRGMGLLPIRTAFASKKTLRQVSTKVPPLSGFWSGLGGIPVTGYEIHMGESFFTHDDIPLTFCAAGRVFGTYVHGIFDSPAFSRKVLTIISHGALRDARVPESAAAFQDRQLDYLADVLRESLDMDLLYRTIGL